MKWQYRKVYLMIEKQFISKIRNKQPILIYGAGMVGKLVYLRLIANGLAANILGFVQTIKTKENYLNVPIYEIQELSDYRKYANVIIATLPALHDDILANLHIYKFQNIWEMTEELYIDMCQKYIAHSRATHILGEKVIDILFFASDNNSSSGAFLCMLDINIELKKKGISSAVILPEYGNGEEILIEKQIDYVYIPSSHWAKLIGKELPTEEQIDKENFLSIKEIENFIVQHQVKIVHNNTIYTYVGAVAALNKNIPYVWHIRENIIDQGFTFINSQKSIQLINQAKKIIAVSKFITSCYQGLNPLMLSVCYDGVNINEYYKKKSLFSKKKLVIIQVGVIAPIKNQEELIKAAYIIKNKKINFLIQFIGSGEKTYIEYLHKLIKLYQLEHEIIFCGRLDNVNPFYQNADIAVICSKSESFGRITIEAQLSGCLVIGSNTGATPELIKDKETGFLYKYGNSEDLAEKIIYVAENSKISQDIALNGQRQAYNLYSKERNAEEIIKLYQEILADCTKGE